MAVQVTITMTIRVPIKVSIGVGTSRTFLGPGNGNFGVESLFKIVSVLTYIRKMDDANKGNLLLH